MDIECDKLNQSEYLKIAIPFMLSTLTQPLLGIVDTAVVGRMESPIFIGGVSIGVTIFNTLYWLFGFLRVSTTSYSAQAIGDDNNKKKIEAFIHPLIIAIIVGLGFILMKDIIWTLAMKILAPEKLVMEQSRIYYNILIYGAPVVFVNYVILGWLMGQSKVKESVTM
ncbi:MULTISPECIES: MATE family efflux transporter [unclassified Romboutsia]|uniref:MATE family efflux transporter n=1 Tax=unclassified Romboutsia TaxID=2626894 RepID=UPI000F070850|nr:MULTISPECIES: MATE family efflux transporter [unclassified Romboutsia]